MPQARPRVLLVQGANMTYLGKRQPEIYGTTTAAELDALLLEQARASDCELEIFYTHVEGEAIGRIYDFAQNAAEGGADGIMMNPAGFSYAGYALRDCLNAVTLPYVEVHMTNVERRGIHSVIAERADGVVFGLGVQSYVLGLQALLHLIAARTK